MLRQFYLAIALSGLVIAPTLADSIWLGSVNNDWTNASNWNNGSPGVTTTSQRANIESTTDLANWPTIHNGETVNMTQRIQAPLSVPGAGQTMYSRLTVESGGTLSTTSDFRMADSGSATQPTIGSLNVAGALSVGGRLRFGDSLNTTVDVDVPGTLTQTNVGQDFRIGTGTGSTVTFDIMGSGLASSASSTFAIGAGGAVRLSNNGTLTVNESATFLKPAILTLLSGYTTNGRLVGLTDTYTGGQPLTPLGSGVAYYEGATSLSFVASTIPEPATVIIALLLLPMGFAGRVRARRH